MSEGATTNIRLLQRPLPETARFRALFDGAERLLGLLTPDGALLEVNAFGLSLLGRRDDEIADHDLWEPALWKGDRWRLGDDDAARLRDAVVRAAHGKPARLEIEPRSVDGAPLVLTLRPSRDAAGHVNLIVVEGNAAAAPPSRQRRAFSHAAVGMIVTDADGRLTEVNVALCDLFGRSAAELDRQHLSDLIHPDDADTCQEALGLLRSGEVASAQFEKRLRHDDGDPRWGHVTMSAVRDPDGGLHHVLVQIHDVTQRKLAELALQESEARYRSVVSALHEGVIVQDRSGAVLASNPSAERLLGLDPQAGASDGKLPNWHGLREDGVPLGEHEHPAVLALSSGRPQTAVVGIERGSDTVWIAVNAVPLQRPGEDAPYAVVTSFNDISALKEKERQLEHSAYHDPLTELPNRRYFFEIARGALADAERKKSMRDAILYLDLDDFKRVNDVHGHAAGDELLVQVTRRLRNCIRPGDVAARIAGDEFAMLLLDIGSVWNGVRVAQRVLETFKQPFSVAGLELKVGVSIGIAMAPDAPAAPDPVVNQADIALRRAKVSGRSQYVIYDAHLDNRLKASLELETDLRQALGRKEFQIHYQPIIDLAGGTVSGAEALLRWQHRERGMVSPAEFIPISENNGTIHPIGEWVLEQSLEQLKGWLVDHPSFHLGINLSPRQLESPQFLTTFARLLGVSGVPHDAVMLELTETYLMQDVERAARDLRRFAGLGVRIAIDDFGTGYSSLKYLQHLPITDIKIDRSFVQNSCRDERSRVLVETILLLADKLGLNVIAEGVETEEQATFLDRLGCDLVQGYLYSRPMPMADFDSYLVASAASTPR